ncbi:MAG: Gfo/Idh/MocA family oxidoreductase [Chloroflexi bacterium]|nr:Gfo/Idh/MocA family oxidoreductase [Chloroflexota bacterium]
MSAGNAPLIRIGVAGTGFGARVQIPGFLKLDGVEVSAVMSGGRLENARRVASDFKIKNVCASFEELLQVPGLDAVSIATPPYQHRDLTLQALAAGKHVLCEKPMATNLEEARQMLEAARRSGLVAMIDHEFRYVPARAFASELIQQGWLGQLISANVTMLSGSSADPVVRPWNWLFDREAGGGFLGALGSHYIDALRGWFGEIAAVSAEIDTVVKSRYLPNSNEMRAVTADDSFVLLCRFARGGTAIINVSVVVPFGNGERIELYGSRGALILDNEGRIYCGRVGEDRLQLLQIPSRFTGGPSSGDQRLRPFVTLAGDFLEAIRRVKAAGNLPESQLTPSFRDGYKVQQVIEAARQSAETKCWVSLPPL